MRVRIALALLFALASCRAPVRREAIVRPPRAVRAPAEPAPGSIEVAWPRTLLAADAEGPAIFRRSSATARGYAWIAGGTEIEPRGPIQNGRVFVHVGGALRVRGYMPVDRFEAFVSERGRVNGTPLYLVPGDRVHLVSARGSDAVIEASALLAHPDLERSPLFQGEFPFAQLASAPEGSGQGASNGEPVRLRASFALYGEPNGEPIWQPPALGSPMAAVLLRDRGEWLGVRIGLGPYLVGYVPRSALEIANAQKQDGTSEVVDPWRNERVSPIPLAPAVSDPWARETQGEPPAHPPLPPRLESALVRPLFAVRRGTRVRVDGTTVAVFERDGHAVELERRGADALVLAAADESITVQGIVRGEDLIPIEGP
jgi:hypothetical protein